MTKLRKANPHLQAHLQFARDDTQIKNCKRACKFPTQEKLFFKISFPSKIFKTQPHRPDRTATRLDNDCKKYTVDTDTTDRTTGHNIRFAKMAADEQFESKCK